jgi:hypothetical protein
VKGKINYAVSRLDCRAQYDTRSEPPALNTTHADPPSRRLNHKSLVPSSPGSPVATPAAASIPAVTSTPAAAGSPFYRDRRGRRWVARVVLRTPELDIGGVSVQPGSEKIIR